MRAKKKVAAKIATKSRKTKKVIAVKAVKAVKSRKPVAKKPARKASRRTAAEVTKLRKAVIASAKKGKTAESIAAELGISKAYVYALKNAG